MPTVLVGIGLALENGFGAWLIVNASAIATGLAVVASLAYSAYQQNQARRAAIDAYNSSLADRLQMVAVANGARSRVYGRVRNVDGVLFKATYGDKSQFYRLVVAHAGHQCDAIETVYFGDQALTLGATDDDGWQPVLTAPFAKDATNTGNDFCDVVGGAGSVVLPRLPIAGSVHAFIGISSGDSTTELSTPVTVTGSTVSIVGAPVDGVWMISYQWASNSPKARIRKWHGSPLQNLAVALMEDFPSLVQSTDRFAGICATEVDLEYDTDVFTTGVPNVTAVLRGARVRDIRTGADVWTENSALIARDWALYAHGGACPPDCLDDDDVIAAANVCDLEHTFHTGPTTGRTMPLYTCGIAIKLDEQLQPDRVMDEIVLSMAGKWGWGGGLLKMRAGAWRAPVALITEDWLSGADTLTIVPEPPADQAVNVVRAQIADADQAYAVAPMPELRAEPYLTVDGRELPHEVTYGAITDVLHAQHVSGVGMRDQRSGLTGTLPCNLRALPLELFDPVYLRLPRFFGSLDKEVEILGWQFTATGGVVLSYKETGATIFDPDAQFHERDDTPNTYLPSPFDVPTIAGLVAQSGTTHLVRQADGTIVSRVWVTWPTIGDEAVLACDQGVTLAWGPPSAPETYTLALPGNAAGAYLTSGVVDERMLMIKARARNTLVRGVWGLPILHYVVGKTAPPSNGADFAASIVEAGVRFRWASPIDPDYAESELRYGASWAAGILIWQGAATGYTWQPPVGSYTVWLKHRDTSGNESVSAVSVIVTVDPAAAIQWTDIAGIAVGVNQLHNADFALGLRGWSIAGLSGIAAEPDQLLVGWSPTLWVLNQGAGTGSGTLSFREAAGNSGAAGGHYADIWSDPIPVAAGMWYAASAYTGAHRCRVAVFAIYADASGAAVGASLALDSVVNGAEVGGGVELAGYKRCWSIGAAPAGAATARLVLRKYGTEPSETSSFLFACRPQFEEVGTGAVVPGPWSPGQVGYTGDLDATYGANWATNVAGAAAVNEAIAAARDAADDAQEAAEDAATDASNALTALTAIASDAVLTRGEKPAVILDWTTIYTERPGIDAQAASYGITTERSGYTAAYNALATYLGSLSPSWDDLSADTPITGGDFRAAFANLYGARQALLDKIYDAAKYLADTAQTSASNALTAAGNAQTAANGAATNANAALTALTAIASDAVLTRGEKPRVIIDWTAISGEQAGIDAQADNYAVATERTAYDNAVTALAGYLAGLSPGWNDVGADTPIDGATFRTRFATVYTTRQAVLDKIAANAKDRLGGLAVMDAVGSPQIQPGGVETVNVAVNAITAPAAGELFGVAASVAVTTSRTTRRTITVVTTSADGDGEVVLWVRPKAQPAELGLRNFNCLSKVAVSGTGQVITFRWRVLRSIGGVETVVYEREVLDGSPSGTPTYLDFFGMVADTPGAGVAATYIYEVHSSVATATNMEHEVMDAVVAHVEFRR